MSSGLVSFRISIKFVRSIFQVRQFLKHGWLISAINEAKKTSEELLMSGIISNFTYSENKSIVVFSPTLNNCYRSTDSKFGIEEEKIFVKNLQIFYQNSLELFEIEILKKYVIQNYKIVYFCVKILFFQ